MDPDLPGADRPSRADATAARAAVIMAYAVAVAGALGATVALRASDPVAALLVLTTTLGVATVLAATGTVLRSLREIERRLGRVERMPRGLDPGSAPR
jgi:hypothetical protein